MRLAGFDLGIDCVSHVSSITAITQAHVSRSMHAIAT